MADSQPGADLDKIEWTGGPPAPARHEPHPADFARSAVRVGILTFLAAIPYYFWWFWQFFLFARRENLPRARAFWWILVPIYGWVVIYRAFEDLDQAALRLRVPGLPAGFVVVLFFGSYLASVVSNSRYVRGSTQLTFFFIASGLTAIALGLGQRSANAYITARYPGSGPRGVTWGEVTATILGLIITGLVILGSLLPQ